MERAVSEIMTAQDYIKIAESFCDQEEIALKFQEIAKDEIEHHNYDMDIIEKEIKRCKESGEEVMELKDSLFYDVYEDWFREVDDRVNNFKVKK
jgi:hypothetical protein